MINYVLGKLGVGYYASRPLSTLTKKEINEAVHYAIWYCRYTFGHSKYNKEIPKVSIVKCPYKESYYGDYCPTKNVIRVFHDNVPTLGALTSTIIHEYTHYRQPITKKYYKLLDKYGYWNHPQEVEARETESLHNRRALHYIRTNMTKP